MSRALAIFKMIYTRCCGVVLMHYNALCMVRMPIGYAIYTLLADKVNFKK